MNTNLINSVFVTLFANMILSIIAYYISKIAIKCCQDNFKKAGLKGRDYGSKDEKTIPEAIGVISGTVFMMVLFIFIAFPFACNKLLSNNYCLFETKTLVEYLAGLLSISCMVLLGFVDDVLDLRWRYKLIFPLLASIPLVIVYMINGGSTTVLIPKIFNYFFGIFYYLIISCLTIFCSNSINIYSGINGLEVGQSLIISISLIIYGIIEVFYGNLQCLIIIYIMLPFFAVSYALYQFNKYPAQVFVGDTFCYFAGMTFAVVGILSHSSKTIILFFIPQIINFIISLPQLLKMYPCPRHRLPKFNDETLLREPSRIMFKLNTLEIPGCVIIGLMSRFGFAKVLVKPKDPIRNVIAINMTLLNVILRIYGLMSESDLLYILLKIQIFSSFIGFLIRYPLDYLFF